MTTLTDVIDATVDRLKMALSDIPTVLADAPPQAQRALRVPAVYVELAELEPISNLGDTRILADARFEAHCIVDPNAARSHLAVRELASRVMTALHNLRRPLPGHGHIRLIRAGEDGFRPEMDGYMVWMVEWAVEIALGDLEPAGITPSEIYFGMTPAIGPGHVPDYDRIA